MLKSLNQFEFHHVLEDIPTPSLIVFSSPTCGSCRHLEKVLLQLIDEQPDWQIFKVDAQQEPGLTEEFEVFHLPSLFLFYQGQYHCQIESQANTTAIRKAINDALTKPAQEAP